MVVSTFSHLPAQRPPKRRSFSLVRRFLFSLGLPVLALLFLFLPSESGAKTDTLTDRLTGQGKAEESLEPWKIEAATIVYDFNKKIYEAIGDVRITSGNRSLEADWATLESESGQAELRGKVVLRYGQNWLRGDHVRWNIEAETGVVDGGTAYFAESRFYVEGQSIAKTGINQYELEKGFITSCDPQKPDWRIGYDKMRVEVGGYAWAKHTSFWVRDMPLLYWPVLGLPVKQERQSGLLLPWMGVTTLNGVEGELPFYWAIRPDMDATFFGRAMSKRGWMSGLEYRYATEKMGEGVWQFNYLRDQANAEFQLEQGYPLETRDRYWVRSRYSFEMPNQITGRLDVDVASDRNYLKEFVKGSTSYDYSEKAFLDRFGRGILQDRNTNFRESTLYLDQRRESTSLSLDTRYFDQLDRSLDEFTLQRMPALSFNTIPLWIDDLPLYYTFDSSMVNYWRREGDRGNRLDLYPRIAYPLHWKTYLDVQPSIGARSTGYWVDWQEGNRSDWQGRLLADVRVDLSSRVNRVYDLQVGGFQSLQHAVRPEMIYEYIPDVEHGDIPQFDGLDRDQARHDMLFGFSSFLTGKQTERSRDGQDVITYRELARLQILQQFNIERPVRIYEFDPDPKSGFADLFMRLDLMPKRYLTLSYDATLLPDESRSLAHDFYMTLDNGKGQLVRFGYQFRDGYPVDEFIGETSLKILPKVYLTTYHDYSLERKELFNQSYGIKYLHGCWGIGMMYEKERDDQRFYFYVNLLGLGNIGAGGTLGTGTGLTGNP
jgi:LPS-assembly protein